MDRHLCGTSEQSNDSLIDQIKALRSLHLCGAVARAMAAADHPELCQMTIDNEGKHDGPHISQQHVWPNLDLVLPVPSFADSIVASRRDRPQV